MSDFHSKQCDECAALRMETNHWWAVVGAAEQPRFLTCKEADARRSAPFRLDYCSHKCVSTAFNRWLDNGTVAKPEKKAAEGSEGSATLITTTESGKPMTEFVVPKTLRSA